MGDVNTNSTNAVAAVTALANAPIIRKLLRLPDQAGKTNFEVLAVRAIPELATNGHNCEVSIRVDLAFGMAGLPINEKERFSVRKETVRRIDLKDIAEFKKLEKNDKNQYLGTVSDVASVATLLGANIGEDDITISQVKDVKLVRAKATSLGYIGAFTVAAGGAPVVKLPTAIVVTMADEVTVGQKVTGTVVVNPADAADKTYTVTVDKPALATVNAAGTEVTGVAEGVVKVKYVATADATVVAEKTLNVKPLPVVKPTGIEITAENALDLGETDSVTVKVIPENATVKTFTAVSSNPAIIRVEDDGVTLTGVGIGSASVQYVADGDPTVVETHAITVTDPNAGAQFNTTLTLKPYYDATVPEANHINVGDRVTLCITHTGLNKSKAVVIEPADHDVVIDLLNNTTTLYPAGIPIISFNVVSAVPDNAYLTLLIKDAYTGEVLTSTISAMTHDPAVVPTIAMFDGTPPQLPAGVDIGVTVSLDVNEYTTRDVVWASNTPDVVITPNQNPLSAMVHFGASIPVGTQVTLTCTVDGVVATTDPIEIIANPG